MKKLIDYSQNELDNIVYEHGHYKKYKDFYQLLSILMFVLFFFAFLWAIFTEKNYNEQCKINAVQDSCYINALYEQKLSIDTAKWYKEMGIKFEKDLDY